MSARSIQVFLTNETIILAVIVLIALGGAVVKIVLQRLFMLGRVGVGVIVLAFAALLSADKNISRMKGVGCVVSMGRVADCTPVDSSAVTACDVPHISLISVTHTGVRLVLHRPFSASANPETVSLIGSPILSVGRWELLSDVMFRAGETNVDVMVTHENLFLGEYSGHGFFSFTDRQDSDGDGLEDWFERFNSQTRTDMRDTDGDGLTDGEEISLGTDPRPGAVDTDNDGLTDGEEIGYVEYCTQTEIPIPTGELIQVEEDAGIYEVVLPFEMNFGGLCSSVVALSVTGQAAFLTPGGDAMFYTSRHNRNLNAPVCPGEYAAVVSVYWADLPSPRWGDVISGVRFCTQVVNGVTIVTIWFRTPIVYGGMLPSDVDYLEARIVVSSDAPSVVKVVYDHLGPSFDGTDATVGGQGPGRRRTLPVSYNSPLGFGEGDVIAYHFGTGTDPLHADTDGDGTKDGAEMLGGTDPCNPRDCMTGETMDLFRSVPFRLSGDYAAWEMTIKGVGPDDWRTFTLAMESPGSPVEDEQSLRKGNSYRISLRWLNSDGRNNSPLAPWFCWEALVGGLPHGRTFADYSAERLPGEEVIVGDGWIVDNASGLLTSHVCSSARDRDGELSAGNVAEGLTATLHILDFKFSTPFGDPFAIGEMKAGRNQFTYVDETRTLSLPLKVTVKPTLDDRLARCLRGEFEVSSISESVLEWEDADGIVDARTLEGFETVEGEISRETAFRTQVTYRGYPLRNSDFGRKHVRFSCMSMTLGQDVAVFFPKFGTRHPLCLTCPNCSNWFYYWRDGGVCSIPSNARWVEQSTMPFTRGFYDPVTGNIGLTDLAAGESIESEPKVLAVEVTNFVFRVVSFADPVPLVTSASRGETGYRYECIKERNAVTSFSTDIFLDVAAKGIRRVAMTVAHEQCHREIENLMAVSRQTCEYFTGLFSENSEYDRLCRLYGTESKEVAEFWKAYQEGIYDNGDEDESSGDGVPSISERTGYLGLITNDLLRDSIGLAGYYENEDYMRYGDEELRCRYMAPLGIEERYHVEWDWSNPGCQHEYHYGP